MSDELPFERLLPIVSEARVPLQSGRPLSDEQAEHIVATLARVVGTEDAEIAWDDAWDAFEDFGPHHANALPALRRVALTPGCDSAYSDRNVQMWVARCIGRIGVDDESVEVLLSLVGSKDREVAGEAAAVLRRAGRGRLVKWSVVAGKWVGR